MTEKITVGIIRIDGLQALEDCTIDYEFKSEPQGTIDFQHPTIGRHRFTGVDVYEAFEELKSFLESSGYNILCAGSRINTFPSTISR
jgi:hypothetical protein